MPVGTTNIALNVETDPNTQKGGPMTGLNVETSLNDNTKGLSENEAAGLNGETEPSVNMEGQAEGE